MAKKKLLDEIIAELENTEALSKHTDKHVDARAAWQKSNAKPKNYHDLLAKTKEYIDHHEQEVNGTKLDDATLTARAHQFIVAYGRNSMGDEKGQISEKVLIKNVLNQVKKRGIYGILDSYRDNEIAKAESDFETAVIQKNVDPLDFEHNASLAGDYITKYANLLSKDDLRKYTKLKPEALADQAIPLLKAHRARKKEVRDIITYEKAA